ncbi:hypothetical protein [Acetobacter fabarum]|uniref:hypothetical protein n=1 Tax=Acetobacter fabarum TaxID=483199 RepID=UPI0039EA83F7
MIDEIRAQALAHAMELAKRAGELEASSIVKNASVFEDYLTGTVNDLSSLGEDGDRLIEGRFYASRLNGGKSLPRGASETGGDEEDQPLTSCSVTDCAHSNSSSVQDGESVGELPTPSRTETVAAPSDTEEATRTHGGAA